MTFKAKVFSKATDKYRYELRNKNKSEGIMERKATKKQIEILKECFATVNLHDPKNITKLQTILKKCPRTMLFQLENSDISYLAWYAKQERIDRALLNGKQLVMTQC